MAKAGISALVIVPAIIVLDIERRGVFYAIGDGIVGRVPVIGGGPTIPEMVERCCSLHCCPC